MTQPIHLQPPKRTSGIDPQLLVDLASFQQILDRYWPWHYEPEMAQSAKRLLAVDLKWEKVEPFVKATGGLTTQQRISPLGIALSQSNRELRSAAFHILDSVVKIPAGEVLLGQDLTPLPVEEFRLGRYPVTNAQYHRFIEATGTPPPANRQNSDVEPDNWFPPNDGDHPVTGVKCTDAEAYATWAGGRLPSFEEWERAARGNDGRTFPWGDEIDKPRCNTAEAGVGTTTPIGMFPEGVSPFGCYDLLGNVWEWSSTWYDDDQQFRVVRGGSWYYNHEHATCTSYDFFSQDYAEFVIGFRLAFN
ncbi:hypothetical protein CMK12_04685 [Candidatus Poribacteria bacterium]|nr:hypothetical protein [Candidatus Poribacteria bacterium]MDP6597077.1 SUMF1/EgtB/PvdO family nonheme iron enzyme [Candidatus Poribacteria bacterium]MDP6997406.1 SUMF1/EgtB/PvdO family nonheme iron enzyme [Candidatus Poribacteria bacterium]